MAYCIPRYPWGKWQVVASQSGTIINHTPNNIRQESGIFVTFTRKGNKPLV